jgi:hypothetical protein
MSYDDYCHYCKLFEPYYVVWSERIGSVTRRMTWPRYAKQWIDFRNGYSTIVSPWEGA